MEGFMQIYVKESYVSKKNQNYISIFDRLFGYATYGIKATGLTLSPFGEHIVLLH